MIAVVSDSHVPNRAEKIPEEFRERMREADLTVHAGDFVEKPVKNGIEEYGELIAVKGNCDFFDLPNSEEFERNGAEFGVYHGTGIAPRGDHETLEKIAADDMEVDVLITGHTHEKEITELDRCVILNPGSCTGVSGGIARPSDPTMMEIHSQEKGEFEVKVVKDEDGELSVLEEDKISV